MPSLISIIVPAYNERENVEELARRLGLVFAERLPGYAFEAIIVENGSADDTWEKLEGVHLADPRFKAVQLARNFRMDGGITAGLQYATGDAAVIMTADLQDPPEVIPEFVAKWEEGYENVYGIVTERQGTGPIRRLNSEMFYWLAGKLTGEAFPRNASDFRLVDRRVYEAVRNMDERNASYAASSPGSGSGRSGCRTPGRRASQGSLTLTPSRCSIWPSKESSRTPMSC
jgi:dolichol-phosphate mannosyltransferase